MNVCENNGAGQIEISAIRQQLQRILESKTFCKKDRLVKFLTYIVEAALAGESDSIKQYSVGVDALGYQPGEGSDATVRVHARRLRQALEEYYAGPGRDDTVRIELPKGRYVPLFSRVEAAAPVPIVAAPPAASPWTRRYAVAAGIVGIATLATAYALRSKPAEAPPHLHQLTFFSGDTQAPSTSGDGKLLAYSSDRLGAGGNDIWLGSFNAPEGHIQLTRHPADDSDPDLSPDSKWVVFRSTRDGGGLYVVSAAGGEERRLGSGFSPRFSPEGARIAYTAIEESGNTAAFLIPFDGGTPRKIGIGLTAVASPVWSPDGKRLMVLGAMLTNGGSREHDWWIVSADSSEAPVRIHADQALRTFVRDMAHVYPGDWVGNHLLTAGGQLLEVTLDSPETAIRSARRIHRGPNVFQPRYRNRGSNRRVLFSVRNFASHIVGVPIGVQSNRERPRLTDNQRIDYFTSLSGDGTKLAYSSNRSDSWQIFVKDLLTGRDSTVGSAGPGPIRPVLNKAGTRVAFSAGSNAASSIQIAGIASGQTQTACTNCGELRDWSSDESLLLAVHGHALVEVDVSTQARRTITEAAEYDFQEAAWSPDGKWIAAALGVTGKEKLQGIILPSGGGPASKWIPITEELYNLALHWSPDGSLLYFCSRRDDFRCIWAQKVHPVTKQPLGPSFAVEHFHPPQPRILNHGWSTVGGNRLAVHATQATSNIFEQILP